ncbi:MAG: MarR family transcriptional regulator [Clostridiales bacterium]|nr:MarR family transcriptional regulator [Clostridiales bacterium]
MMRINSCPCCGEHCDLNDPQCERGEEYKRIGDDDRKQHRSGERKSEIVRRKQYRDERYESADTNNRIIINLRELGHKIRFRFEGKGSQERVLEILKERGDMTQRELTERLGIKPGSSSEVLAKLESAGMIRRSPNENDRRVVDLSLTDAGREQAQKVSGLREEKQDQMLAALTAEEKETLLGLLEKVNRGWEAQDDEHNSQGRQK